MFRIASRTLLQLRRPTPSLARNFSRSLPRQAVENEDSFLTNYQNTPLFRKLADKPEALKALNEFAKMLQEQGTSTIWYMFYFLIGFIGIDISGSSQPSTSQMIRLAANARFREGAKKVMTELRGAGLDFTSAVRYLRCVQFVY